MTIAKKGLLTLTALTLAAGLNACSVSLSSEPVSGTVVEKEFEPAHEKKIKKVGKKKRSKTKEISECYEITVEATNGTENSGEVCVDQETYESLNIGDHYTAPPN